MSASPDTDCVVVGASFAGLACAWALASAGWRVTVLDKKADVGAKLHTTGLLVREAVEDIPLLDALPTSLVRRIEAVRLHAPSLRSVNLRASGYFFLATDTPGVLRHLAGRAQAAGAHLALGTGFGGGTRTAQGFDVPGVGRTRYLVGADGPASTVARALALGVNRRFLYGIEHEYAGAKIPDPDHLHCFIDRSLAPGYIGWVVNGVGTVQAGLARRLRGDAAQAKAAMAAFLHKLAPRFDLADRTADAIRAGLIPCGGPVRPLAAPHVLLVGDAAGLVSPLTAGGIHTALKHGLAAGHAVGDFLQGRRDDPAGWFPRTYPRFRGKRVLRFLYDHFQRDWLFNALIGTAALRAAAGLVYFHQRRAFRDPD